ncbi:hypothetical protein COSO111634_36590 [Corallococcus soli]
MADIRSAHVFATLGVSDARADRSRKSRMRRLLSTCCVTSAHTASMPPMAPASSKAGAWLTSK